MPSGAYGKLRAVSPVVVTRFEWPDESVTASIPGMDFRLQFTRRAYGGGGIAPAPNPDEREVARFVGILLTAAFPVDGVVLPDANPSVNTPIKQICSGRAEVLLTDRRMAVVLGEGSGKLGRVSEEGGSVVAIEVPYRAVNSVAVVRKRTTFRGVKDREVRCYTRHPMGALDIEPVVRMFPAPAEAVRVAVAEFADALIDAICADALSATLMSNEERFRFNRVRRGERVVEDLDIVAELHGMKADG
jgi:hypothetical protein